MTVQEGGRGNDHLGKAPSGKSRGKLLLISLALNLFLLSFVASREAAHYMKRHEQLPGPPPPHEMLYDAARALSSEGRATVRSALEADSVRLRALHESLMQAHQAAEKLYAADPFDADAYRQAITAQLDGGRQLFSEISQILVQIGPKLSQADRAQLITHMRGPGAAPPPK
ncbi:MAG: periplasmic heavy metal sensor [Dongiaceae bacterium]